MNEEALKHAYELFVKDGYNGSIDDFRSLISSNKDALNYSYGLFKRDGYFQSVDDYKNLLGVEMAPAPEPVKPAVEEQEVKKKELPVTTESPSEDASLVSPTQPDKFTYEGETSFVQPIKPAVAEGTAIAKPLPKTKKEIQQEYQAYKAVEPERKAVQAEKEITKLSEISKEKKKPEEKSYWGNMYDNLVVGINSLEQIVASIPEDIINVVAIPQNAVAYATGWDIATNADKVKKDLGLRNVLLDKLKEEEEGMKQKIGQYSKQNYKKEGVYDNIQNGNYLDAFKILGSNIAQSVPVSIAMMYGGAALSSAELTAAGTLAFQQENREQLEQDNPNMSEIEKNIKSLGMSAAETVFSSIGEGSIGQVYKEIAKKEGADAAKTILRDGLVETYKSALKKYGAPIGLLGEGLEEAATQVTQNVISGKPAFQGVADSFITGAGSGVVFTAPITAIEAKKRVNNLVETYKSKREINDIIKDKDIDVHTIFNVSKQDPITADQIQIANVNKSRDIFEKNLQRQVKEGSITKEDAQQSLYIFGKVQQVSNAVKDLDISNEDKAVVANLLNKRNELKTKIQNKEDVLVVKEKKEIDDINQQISDIVLKSKTEKDAIQEQATDESVLRTEQPELELPKVVEGNKKPEVTPEQKQAIADEDAVHQEKLDNPYDEQDVEDAKSYFDNPIAYLENKVKFWEEDVKDNPNDETSISILNKAKSALEAHRAAEETPNIRGVKSITKEIAEPLKNVESTTKALDDISKGNRDSKYNELLKQKEQIESEGISLTNQNDLSNINNEIKSIEIKNKIDELNTKLDNAKSNNEFEKIYEQIDNLQSEYKKINKSSYKGYEPSTSKNKDIVNATSNKEVAEAYHKAKADGSNPELVKAIGDLLSKTPKGAVADVRSYIEQVLNPDFKNTIEEKLSKFDERIDNKDFPTALEVAEYVLPREIFNKYKALYELAARNGITVTNAKVPDRFNFYTGKIDRFVAGWGYDNIHINKEGIKSSVLDYNEFAEVLNHEIIHGLISKGIRDEYGLHRDLDYIMDEVEARFDNASKNVQDIISYIQDTSREFKVPDIRNATSEELESGKYRKTRYLEELITYAFTNKEFANFLDSIPATKKVESKGDSIFQQLKNIIRGFIYKIAGKETALDEINLILDKYFDTSFNESDIKNRNEKYDWGLKFKANEIIFDKYNNDPKLISDAYNEGKDIELVNSINEMMGVKGAKSFSSNINGLIDYEKTMDEVDFMVPKSKEYVERDLKKSKERYRENKSEENKKKLDKAKADYEEYKSDAEKAKADAIVFLKESKTYKAANLTQKEELIREVSKRFGEKQPSAPSPEKLLGEPKSKQVVMTEREALKKQIRDIAKGAKEGAKSVKDRIADAKNKIEDYLESVKDYGNLTRADQVKIRKEMMKVEDEKSLDKAVDKINDIIDNAKTDIIEMSEYKMLREMLLVAKEVKDNIEERRKVIKAAIDNITKAGKVSAKQAGKLLNMINKVNLDSDVQVEKVIEYAEKLFNDAEYAEKLEKANGLKSDLQKLSKSKLKNINLRQLARAFAQIKPSMVENIDVYNDIAEKIKEAVRGSRIIGGKELLKIAKMVNIDDVNTFIEESMQYQRERILKDKIAEAEEILGKDVSGMSYDDIVKLIDEANEKNEPVDKDKKTIIKKAIKKLFADSSNTIKDIFSTGNNPITGEDLDISESKKDAVKRFMTMDLDLLTPKQALNAVDALNNFIENGSTAGMDSVFSAYQGEANAKQIVKENESKKTSKGKLIAQNLKIYFSDSLGKTMAEQISSLPLLLDWMFRGQEAGTEISEKSGISSVINEKSSVQSRMNKLAEQYNKQFYKTKVNGKPFNSTVNAIERGILANLRRTKPGTEQEQQAEFDNNKALIEKTIDALKSGNKKEKELSKFYEQAYNNILKGSKNIDDVLNKSNNINISAVDWIQEKWADIYDELADVSENVYNEVLERELNYTTRKWSRLSGAGDAPPLDPSESLFHANNNNGVYKKKAGVLEKTKPVTELPKNSKDEPTMYVDLFFDKSNINAMYDALMDIHTARHIRQVEAFFKSSEIKEIIPIKEDREILFNSNGTGRVQEFVRNIRNKQIVSDSEMSKAIRAINGSATMGVAAALGTVFQPLKQVIPAATHALIHGANVFNHLDIGINADKINFLLNSGYGIGIRGVESLAGVPSLRKSIEAETDPNVGKMLLNLVDNAGKFQLKWLLSSPDLGIARASWLGYYEKALKKQGKNIDNIDYKTHELNKDAADYAQKMVDRQQGVSDKDLQGSFFNSKKPLEQAIAKIAMPFATFRMNQTIRMMSDIITLKDKTSTTEDKQAAALSLTGYAAEMAMFRVVSTLASMGMASLTMYLMGHDETEEEKDKRIKNSIKAQLTGTVSDILSPIPTPAVDYMFVYGVNKGLDLIQNYAMDINEEDRIKLFVSNQSDMLKSLGIFGIAAQRALNFYDTQELIATGHFKDEYGRDKYISQKDRETLKGISVLSFLSNMNLLTADANNITKNAVKYAKKNSSTKEGGQTEEDIQVEEMSKEQRELSKEESKQLREQKVIALDKLKETETDENRLKIIEDKIKEYEMTDEERVKYNQSRKNELFYEKQRLKKLLGKYRTMSDMKRYDPDLYEERFGEDSDWYKEHKDEMEIDKMMNEILREIKDEEENYIEGGESSLGKSKFGTNTFGGKKKQKEPKESSSSFSYKKTKKW